MDRLILNDVQLAIFYTPSFQEHVHEMMHANPRLSRFQAKCSVLMNMLLDNVWYIYP